MEIVFNVTRPFEKDIRKLDQTNRHKIIDTVNIIAQSYASDKQLYNLKVYSPFHIRLQGLESTLYAIRVSGSIRVLATIDEDPIFDRIIITLLRAIKREELYKAYRSIAKSLYQEQLQEIREEEVEANDDPEETTTG